jgi:hypothetical protein
MSDAKLQVGSTYFGDPGMLWAITEERDSLFHGEVRSNSFLWTELFAADGRCARTDGPRLICRAPWGAPTIRPLLDPRSLLQEW